jgi:site-specific DNA-cytosine methylase
VIGEPVGNSSRRRGRVPSRGQEDRSGLRCAGAVAPRRGPHARAAAPRGAVAARPAAIACAVHANAFSGVTVQTDLRRPSRLLAAVKDAGIGHVDILAGGPPCQPFSRAGRSKLRSLEREGPRSADDRPTLWLSFLRFVDALSPTFVLIENVPDLVLWEEGRTIRRICGRRAAWRGRRR